MSRNFDISIGEYYHIYNRGTDKRIIFSSKNDYHRFLSLLYVCNSDRTIHLSDYDTRDFKKVLTLKRGDTLCDIGSYCLMPNHFHILAKEKIEGGMSKMMQKLSTAYTMYFNKKDERSGSLLEGTFKAQHVDTDEYLKYLFAYIHLNPIKLIDSKWKEDGIIDIVRARDFLGEYNYSSYRYHSGDLPQDLILNCKAFPKYFNKNIDFKKFLDDWLTHCQG